MSAVNYSLLAKQFLSGIWEFSEENKSLSKYLGNSEDFAELDLVNQDLNLNEDFKDSLIKFLGNAVLAGCQGPFGDDDFFYGIDYDNVTHYYLEIANIQEKNTAALKKLIDITIENLES